VDGVKFAVDNVPPPSHEDMQKRHLTKEEHVRGFRRLEQLSDMPPNLVSRETSGFFAASLTAYAQHLPLRLSPDDVWQVILYAFKTHVDLHAEELRYKFVKHTGKKRLEIIVKFPPGNGDLSKAAPAARWERDVFPQFSAKIKHNTIGTVHATVATPFSTSSAAAAAAHEVTLMSSMQHYFEYRMGTSCGIPSITLSGLLQDWVDIRARAEQLGALMMPAFRDKWMPILLPILDEFVRAYSGRASAKFWSAMINIRDEEKNEPNEGCMPRSGPSYTRPYTYYTGWIQNLFPYLEKNKINRALQPWEQMVSQGGGRDPGAGIPSIMSSAPVVWQYNTKTFNINFNAGFVGFTQDRDGTLAPAIGWYVTHTHKTPRRLGLLRR